MTRRELIALLGGATAAWPLAARAQQPVGMRRIGVLMAYAESDPEGQAFVTVFQEGLQKLGWTEGRNIQIDYRWASGDVKSMQRLAKELVALQPDVILSQHRAAAALQIFSGGARVDPYREKVQSLQANSRLYAVRS